MSPYSGKAPSGYAGSDLPVFPPDAAHEPGRQMDVLFRKLIARREAGERVTTQDYLRKLPKCPFAFSQGSAGCTVYRRAWEALLKRCPV